MHVTAALCLAACGNDHGYGNVGGVGGEFDVDAGITPAQHGELPCDVQAFLVSRCQGCHANQPINGAPMSLVTYADLTAKNPVGVMVAERGLIRIKATAARMPPPPGAPATPAEIAAFGDWIAAGVPSGRCAPVDDPFDDPVVCTSGTTWTRGDHESPLMHPGRACIACHASSDEGPRFQIGGTVYPTGHEPSDCNGATAAAVEVTDATGRVTTLPVNAAGNFFTSSQIAFPIHVAVVANGKRRSMNGTPPTGDCNGCHTQAGANMAPGRIALP
jgi:hypothetical protein